RGSPGDHALRSVVPAAHRGNRLRRGDDRPERAAERRRGAAAAQGDGLFRPAAGDARGALGGRGGRPRRDPGAALGPPARHAPGDGRGHTRGRGAPAAPSVGLAGGLAETQARRAGLLHDTLRAMAGATSEDEVRALRQRLGALPVYKRIDSCAAEFEAITPYMYSTYEAPSFGEPE